jgi:hypothetical protein
MYIFIGQENSGSYLISYVIEERSRILKRKKDKKKTSQFAE